MDLSIVTDTYIVATKLNARIELHKDKELHRQILKDLRKLPYKYVYISIDGDNRTIEKMTDDHKEALEWLT